MMKLIWSDLLRLGRAIERFRQRYIKNLLGVTDMALLTKDAVWQANDIQIEDVPVPEWGGEVRLRGLSGTERDRFEALSLVKGKGGTKEVNTRNLRARLIAACAINEDGSPMFDSNDILHLGQKSAVALERLFSAASKLSGMSAKDVDELTENLDSDQSDSSTSV